MKRILLSESPETIAQLASWLDGKVSLNERQRSVLALTLLERKDPKIKYGALTRVLKSFNGGERVDELRDPLVESGLLVQLGDDGFGPYEIHFDAAGIDSAAVIEELRAAYAEESDDDGDEAAEEAEVVYEVTEVAEAEPAEEVSADSDEGAADDASAEDDAAAASSPQEALAEKPASAHTEEKPEPDSAPKQDAAPKAKRKRRNKSNGSDRAERKDDAAASERPAGNASDKSKNAGSGKAKKKPSGSAKADKRRGRAGVPAKAQPAAPEPVHRRAFGLISSLRTRVVQAVRKTEPEPEQKPAQKPKQSPKAKRFDDLDRVRAWLDAHEGEQVPYVTRRQRAFQIFNDEKALEGKRGERLMRLMSAKGLNPSVLRIASRQAPPLQGFYALGADQPFLVVENIDAYEEVVALLKGQRSIRLFGTRIGGVIFGAGHNILISHALDEYLHDIGYRYDYVYYAGDIDREGARLVERAREVNGIEIRLHAGIYRAMLAAQRAHVRAGGNGESAADNQDAPRDFVRLVKDLPPALRIPFRRALRENIRIPQEILTSEDFRRGSMSAIDRLMDR